MVPVPVAPPCLGCRRLAIADPSTVAIFGSSAAISATKRRFTRKTDEPQKFLSNPTSPPTLPCITYTKVFDTPPRVPVHSRENFLKSLGFHIWSDASWLLRSPAGFIIFLLGGPIDWASKLIRVICHSSSEAELGAGCLAGKKGIFALQFVKEFHVTLSGPIIMFIDNSAADDLTKQ